MELQFGRHRRDIICRNVFLALYPVRRAGSISYPVFHHRNHFNNRSRLGRGQRPDHGCDYRKHQDPVGKIQADLNRRDTHGAVVVMFNWAPTGSQRLNFVIFFGVIYLLWEIPYDERHIPGDAPGLKPQPERGDSVATMAVVFAVGTWPPTPRLTLWPSETPSRDTG